MLKVKSGVPLVALALCLSCRTGGTKSVSLDVEASVGQNPCSFVSRLGEDLESSSPPPNQFNLPWDVFLSAAHASLLAYESPQRIQLVARSWGFTTIDVVQEAGLAAFVASNARCMIVAFRGTDEIRNWFTNGQLFAKPVLYGRVHSGFYNAFMSTLNARVSTYIRAQDGQNKTVWVTGHSLGGALAGVLAYATSLVDAARRDAGFEYIVTFGQPLLADDSLAQHLGQQYQSRYFRVVNAGDVVTRVPPGYKHFGSLVWFRDDQVIFRPELSPGYVGAVGSSAEPASVGDQGADTEPLSSEEFNAFMDGRERSSSVPSELDESDEPIFGADDSIGSVGSGPPPGTALSFDDHKLHHYIREIRSQLGLR